MKINEESWVLTGGVLGRLFWAHLSHRSEGHPGSVDFPYNWFIKREETKKDCVGMYHTHPGFSATPSLRDYSTMRGWITCFGKPLMCLIEGIDGLKAYWFFDDESECIPCHTVKQFGQLIIAVLPPKKRYGKSAVVLPDKEKENISAFLPHYENYWDDDPHIIDWDDQDFFDSSR